MINIHLSKNSDGDFDIVFEDGKIKMAEGGTAVAVAVTERLLLLRKEALASPIINTNADPQAGTDYFGVIFRPDASRAEKELEIKRVILSTPGVEGITQWTYTPPTSTRTAYVNFQIMTSWGSFDISQEIAPL